MNGDFDAMALFRAMDARRAERELSWRQVADQVWEQSAVLNARRRDHPISPSTLTGIARRRDCSCQHALFILRWLGEAPERFVAGSSPDGAAVPLPAAAPDQRPRWDLAALYVALDRQRRTQELTWAELAARIGCTQHQLTGIRTARFAIGMKLAMRIVQWLGRPAAEFIYPARW
jgi:hypothetical protein